MTPELNAFKEWFKTYSPTDPTLKTSSAFIQAMRISFISGFEDNSAGQYLREVADIQLKDGVEPELKKAFEGGKSHHQAKS
jgi:hypothetical protein